jgi:hypothetical protein
VWRASELNHHIEHEYAIKSNPIYSQCIGVNNNFSIDPKPNQTTKQQPKAKLKSNRRSKSCATRTFWVSWQCQGNFNDWKVLN